MVSRAALDSDHETPADVASDVPVSRRDRRTARTRQAILDAARQLIDEQGYGQTTIDQIADRADVAARTFFRHFASKEALLFANFEEHRRQMLDLIRAQPTDGHPLRAVLDGLSEFCEVVERDRDSFIWAFRIMDEHDMHYEQSMLKAETSERISGYIAERLGVDPAVDCRPHAWAMVALGLFGNAMKAAYSTGGSGRPRDSFESLLRQTGACFEQVLSERDG